MFPCSVCEFYLFWNAAFLLSYCAIALFYPAHTLVWKKKISITYNPLSCALDLPFLQNYIKKDDVEWGKAMKRLLTYFPLSYDLNLLPFLSTERKKDSKWRKGKRSRDTSLQPPRRLSSSHLTHLLMVISTPHFSLRRIASSTPPRPTPPPVAPLLFLPPSPPSSFPFHCHLPLQRPPLQ